MTTPITQAAREAALNETDFRAPPMPKGHYVQHAIDQAREADQKQIEELRDQLEHARELLETVYIDHNEPGGAPDENYRPCSCDFCKCVLPILYPPKEKPQ